MARMIPRVCDGLLTVMHDRHTQTIVIESEAWWEWVRTARSFRFESSEGHFTARCESIHGNSYWYAYRRQRGCLAKRYLGKAQELTIKRLTAIADDLTRYFVDQQHVLFNPMKWSAPPLQSITVSRQRLTDRLRVHPLPKLVLISAPAGFGKTTLLSEWCSRPYPATRLWVSLDTADNDPVRFWLAIILALQTVNPHMGDRTLALIQAPQSAPLQTIVATLVQELTLCNHPMVLICDDYHHITAHSIHAAMASLIDQMPPNLRIVMISRTDLPLPLARLRAHGDLTEIRMTELQFTPDEATTFFNQRMALGLPPEAIKLLVERTEGWIVGLHLAALALQGQDDPQTLLMNFTGSHHYIADYLVEEVLHQQPDDIQQFLLTTSILQRLTGPLCDTVTGQSDSHNRLKQLTEANLFLVPLDAQRRWYRYHHLFAEMLHNSLQRTCPPSQIATLHRRASAWYAHQGWLIDAVTHALAAKDLIWATQLMEQASEQMLVTGVWRTLLDWVQAVPDHLVRSRPRLTLMYAWVLFFTGQMGRIDTYIQCVERQTDSRLEPDNLAGRYSALQACRTTLQGDITQSISLAKQALASLPTDDLLWRSIVAIALGTAYRANGDLAQAERSLVEVDSLSRTSQYPLIQLTALGDQATVQMLQGTLHRAAATYTRALHIATIHQLDQLPLTGSLSGGFGALLLEWNDIRRATDFLLRGIEIGMQWDDVGVLLEGYVPLIWVKQGQGDAAGATVCLHHADYLAQRSGIPFWIATVAATGFRLQLVQGQVNAACLWLDRYADLQRNLLAPQHEAFALALAHCYILNGAVEQALQQIADLLLIAEQQRRVRSIIAIEVLHAWALFIIRRETQAIQVFRRVLGLAQPEGYIRLFADAGVPIVDLLCATQMELQASSSPFPENDILLTYLKQLLPVCRLSGAIPIEDMVPPTQISSLPEQLNPRELEVLILLTAGYSNRAIAEQLVIAVSTVKWHTNNIYRKLQVESRTQAIARARALGLTQT